MRKTVWILFFITYPLICGTPMGLQESGILDDTEEEPVVNDWLETIEEIQKYDEALHKLEKEERETPAEPEPPEIPEEPTTSETATTDHTPETEDDTGGTGSRTSSNRGYEPVEIETQAVQDPVVHEREVFARLDAGIDISLPGKGWIYTGERLGRQGVEFIERLIEETSTLFVFRVDNLGDYTLTFQRQELSTATVYQELIHVSVLPDEEFFRAVSGESVEIEGGGDGDYRAAKRMLEGGRKKEALAEFLRQYVEGDPEIDSVIAGVAYDLGKYSLARDFWLKNQNTDSPFREEAVIGLFRVAVAEKDQRSYDMLYDEFMEIPAEGKSEIILDAALFQEERGNIDEAIILFTAVLEEPAGIPGSDLACFRLGIIFETSEKARNIQKAYDYYERVTLSYPSSQYWEPSKERMEYLNRHFLKIR